MLDALASPYSKVVLEMSICTTESRMTIRQGLASIVPEIHNYAESMAERLTRKGM